mgnify:CR=1 FL=1
MKRDLYLDYLIRCNKADKITLRVKEAEQKFLEEALFWNSLGMALCSCDLKTSRELNDWVSDVLFTNYPEYCDKLSEYHNAD